MSTFYLLGIVVAWYVVNSWLIPRLRTKTGKSGSCKFPRDGKQNIDPDSSGVSDEK